MKVRIHYRNVSLTLGLLILLWMGELLLSSFRAEELFDLLFPSGADGTRIRFLVNLGILITAAVAAITIINAGKED